MVLHHMCVTGHVLGLDSFTILEREADWRQRGIREAIYVKRVVPGLTRVVDCAVTCPQCGTDPSGSNLYEPADLKMALD